VLKPAEAVIEVDALPEKKPPIPKLAGSKVRLLRGAASAVEARRARIGRFLTILRNFEGCSRY
jgi:hypothetical protein